MSLAEQEALKAAIAKTEQELNKQRELLNKMKTTTEDVKAVAATFSKECGIPFSIVRGKVQTIRNLHIKVPSELIPASVLRLKTEYDAGKIVKEQNPSRWYQARKRLRQYGLIEPSQYGKCQSNINPQQYQRTWRLSHAGYSACPPKTNIDKIGT